jgi:hypothetical protein
MSLNLDEAILPQRKWLQPSNIYSKTLLANQHLDWIPGTHDFNKTENQPNPEKDLILIHLHRMDFDLAWSKCLYTASINCSQEHLDKKAGYQNRYTDIEDFTKWFYEDFHDGNPYNPIPIPKNFLGII